MLPSEAVKLTTCDAVSYITPLVTGSGEESSILLMLFVRLVFLELLSLLELFDFVGKKELKRMN